MFRLLDTLRRLPSPVTAARLAAEMEVSERTIYRDIDTLRASGAIIDGEAGFGFTLTEDSAVPPQMFDRIEIEALVLGLSWLQWQGDAELIDAAERALAKVVASLPERKAAEARHVASLSYVFQPRDEAPPHMAVLRRAIWDECVVDLTYRDRNGDETRRMIWPLAVVYTEHKLWLMAWCCLRRDFRRFQMVNIEALTVTQESFRPRRVPLLRDMFEQMRGRER
ncbi:helix-turn-helix transcriptional regulator [Maritimibacter sp. DP1N21-5]|uniref:helix-turn-helix transcriptional regulator n=1 Tax=Maritimibacter sp. DP1N21-5 TaxID=2836867 RepID=UPI00351DA4B6